ncbi:MAG: glycoside hydrolase domain-containing protein [Candidatus Sigynarchaeota archaeon]
MHEIPQETLAPRRWAYQARAMMREHATADDLYITRGQGTPMNVLRNYPYEILSIGIGLSAFLFFGIIAFSPFMLMIFGENNDFPLAVIIIILSLVLAMVLVSLYKGEKAAIIARVADIAAAASAILVVVAYMAFSGHTHEPWLTQGGWFLRYNGGVVGCFLGATAVKVVAALSFLIAKVAEAGDAEGARSRTAASALVVAAAFGMLRAAMFLFRAVNFIGPAVLFLVATVGCLAIFAIETKPGRPASNLVLEPGDVVAAPASSDAAPASPDEIDASFLHRLSRRLEAAGTKTFDFWVYFVPLLVFGGLALASAIVYPADLSFVLEYIWEGNRIHQVLYINEVLPLVTLFLMLLVSPAFVCLGIARGKLHLSAVKGIAKKLQISTVSFFDGLRYILTTFVMAFFLFTYDYELFYPGVVGTIALFAIAGAAVYWALARVKGARHALAALAVVVLLVNILLVYEDGVRSGYNVYDGTFDVRFPFTYLHGLANIASVGFALGIISCDFLKDAGFDHAGTGGDSTNRAVFIALSFIATGMLVIPLGVALDFPGGSPDWPMGPVDPASIEGSVFYWVSIVFAVVLAVISITRAVTGWVVPAVARGNAPPRREVPVAKPPRKALPKHAHAVSLLAVVGCSAVAAVAAGIAFQVTQAKPIIAYSLGNYCIWLEGSATRVDKDLVVADDPAMHVSTVNITTARNEYNAFQLVVRSFASPLNSFSWNVTRFDHVSLPSTSIPASACTIRYEQRVLRGEYHDVLVPFTTMDLGPGTNHVLWVSLRTPYNATAGRYLGIIELSFGAGQHERVDVSVEVWNFTVPRTRHLRTQVGGESWSAAVVQNFADHRINDYGVSIPSTWTGSDWTFDWGYWDAQVQSRLDRGANSFSLGGGPGWTYDDGRTPFIDNPGLMDQLAKWLAGVQAHLVAKNWTRYCYIYYVDEFQMFIPAKYNYNRTAYFADLKTQLQAMKAAAPLLRIMTTTPPTAELEALSDYIDIYCPIASDYDEQRWNAYIAAGKEFWTYSCVGPWAPWPNSHLYNRLHETRVLIWQVWHYKIDGFLYWSAQAYYHGKYGLGYNGYGDGWFLYQNGSLYDSMRWENYLDGQEDYEYAWLLNATIARLEADGILTSAQAAARRSTLDSLATAVARDRWHYCDTPDPIYQGRAAIGAMLHELSAYTNITAIGEAYWNPLG